MSGSVWDKYKIPQDPSGNIPEADAVLPQRKPDDLPPAAQEKAEAEGRRETADKGLPKPAEVKPSGTPKYEKKVYTGGTDFKLERPDGTPIDVDLPKSPALIEDPDRPVKPADVPKAVYGSPAMAERLSPAQRDIRDTAVPTAGVYGSPAVAEREARLADEKAAKAAEAERKAQAEKAKAAKPASTAASPALADKASEPSTGWRESPASARMKEEKYYPSPAQLTGFAVREAREKLTGKPLDVDGLMKRLEDAHRSFDNQLTYASPTTAQDIYARRKKAVEDAVATHATAVGSTNRRALEMEAASRGIPLASMIEQYETDDKSTPRANDIVEATKRRGVDLERLNRLDDIDINWASFSPQIFTSSSTTGVLGNDETDKDVEIVKPGELGYEAALMMFNAVEEDGYNVGYITKLSNERGGAQRWVEQRTADLTAGLTSADPQYDEKMGRAYQRAIAEIFAFKTIDLWASPIFMNDLIAPDYSKGLGERLWDAVKNQQEVIGYGPTSDPNKPRLITRARSAPATFFDAIDIPQQATVGFVEEIAKKGWDQADFAEGAIKGIEDKRDFMQAAVQSDWAKPTQVYDAFGQLKLDSDGNPVMEGEWKPLVAGGLGFAASALFPDMTLYAGKAVGVGTDVYKGLRDWRRLAEATNLVDSVIALRSEGAATLRHAEEMNKKFRDAIASGASAAEVDKWRLAASDSRQLARAAFDEAAVQEAKLRSKYKMVAEDVDRMDAGVAADLAKDNPDIFNTRLAQAASQSDELLTLHPSMRRMKTKAPVVSDMRAKQPTELSTVDYEDLFNTSRIIGSIDQTLGETPSAEAVARVLRTTASNDVADIRRVIGDDDVAVQLLNDIEDTLPQAVADPKAWSRAILDRRNDLPSINPPDDAADAVKEAAKEKRKRLVRAVVNIYSKAKAAAKDASTDIRGRAIDAALTNNESRIAAASIMSERLRAMRGSKKSQLKNIQPDTTIDMALEKADYDASLTDGGLAFKKMLIEAGLPEKEAQVAAVVTDARARVASWKRGISTDEWYATRIEGVVKGDASKFTADTLYQESLAKNTDVSRLAVPEGFFSPLQRAIAKVIGDNNGKPVKSGYLLQQVKKQSGVKADELQWSGLEEFLTGKERVSLEEVTEWLTTREPVVEVRGLIDAEASEAVKAIGNRIAETDRDASALRSEIEADVTGLKNDLDVSWFLEKGADPVTISQCLATIYGAGEQGVARSVLVREFGKMSVDAASVIAADVEMSKQLAAKADRYTTLDIHLAQLKFELKDAAKDGQGIYGDWIAPGPSSNYREIRFIQPAIPSAGGDVYQHFEPNAIAHMRVTDRTTEDGKKVLFVEEIQSDWHQAGAKEGYWTAEKQAELDALEANRLDVEGELDSLRSEFARSLDGDLRRWRDMADNLVHSRASLEARVEMLGLPKDKTTRYLDLRDVSVKKAALEAEKAESVSQGAHAETWRELALKQALIIAAREGYDGVAMTRGPVIARVAGGSGVGGELPGQLAFYEEILPNTAASLAKKNGSRLETTRLNVGAVVDDDKVKELRGIYARLKQLEPEDIDTPEGLRDRVLKNNTPEVDAEIDNLKSRVAELVDDSPDKPDFLPAAWKKVDGGVSNVPYIPVTDAMKAKVESEGLPLFSRDTVNTPAFKKWFGDSKVVDADGRPLVVYHGTTGDYDRLKGSKEGAFGSGIYLTEIPGRASVYAEGPGGNVVPAYVSLENPLTVSPLYAGTDPVVSLLVKTGMDEKKASAMVEKAYEERGYIGKQLQSRAQAAGHDGIIVYNSMGEISELVVWNPAHVKSIHNSGAFNPQDPRLLYSKDASTAARLVETHSGVVTGHGSEFINRELLRGVTTAKEAAAMVYRATRNPTYVHLSSGLMQLLDSDATFAVVNRAGKRSTAGNWRVARAENKRYYPDAITVASSAGYVSTQTILHELVHSATSQLLHRAFPEPGFAERAVPLTKKQREAADGVKRCYDILQEELRKPGAAETLGLYADEATGIVSADQSYGFTDVHEFVAEAFTNPEFQAILARIPSREPKKSMWQELLSEIAKLLGQDTSEVSETLLNDVINHGSALMRNDVKGKNALRAKAPEATKGNFFFSEDSSTAARLLEANTAVRSLTAELGASRKTLADAQNIASAYPNIEVYAMERVEESKVSAKTGDVVRTSHWRVVENPGRMSPRAFMLKDKNSDNAWLVPNAVRLERLSDDFDFSALKNKAPTAQYGSVHAPASGRYDAAAREYKTEKVGSLSDDARSSAIVAPSEPKKEAEHVVTDSRSVEEATSAVAQPSSPTEYRRIEPPKAVWVTPPPWDGTRYPVAASASDGLSLSLGQVAERMRETTASAIAAPAKSVTEKVNISVAAGLLEANQRAADAKAEVDRLTDALDKTKKRADTVRKAIDATKKSKISPDRLRDSVVKLRAEAVALKSDIETIGEQLKAAKATHAEASKAATLAKKADEAAGKVVVKADKKGESVPVTQARVRLTAAKKEYNAAARQLAEAKIALADAVSSKAKPGDIKTLKLRVEAAAALEKAKGAVVESANNLLSKTLAGEAKATPITPTVQVPSPTAAKVSPGKPVTPTDATSAPLPAAHGTPMGGVAPAVKASPDAADKNYVNAHKVAEAYGRVSATTLQRELGISAAESARVMEKMRVEGVLTDSGDGLRFTYTKPSATSSVSAVNTTKTSPDAASAVTEEELYQDAVDFISKEGKASASMIQRQFKIGYNRAGAILDRMEKEGIVGNADNYPAPREVFGRKTPRPTASTSAATAKNVSDLTTERQALSDAVDYWRAEFQSTPASNSAYREVEGKLRDAVKKLNDFDAADVSKSAPTKTLDASTPSAEATAKMPVDVEEVDDTLDASRVTRPEAAQDAEVTAHEVTRKSSGRFGLNDDEATVDAALSVSDGVKPTGAQKLPRGAVTFAEDGRAIIHAFEGANVETVMHEIGHIMRRDLDADEVDDVVTWMRAHTGDNSLDIVDGRMVSDSGADAIVTAEEVFAEGFVGYLRTGIAPTNNLQRAFDYMKTWLREIYKAVRGFFPTSVSKETGAMFEKLLSVEKSEEAMRKAMASGIDPKATPNIIKRVYKELIGPTLPQAPKTMDELAKAARASGLDVDAAALDDMMKRHGKIDFPHPVAGKATYTDEDLRRFQATVERARGAAREEARLKQALSGAHEAIVEETPTEALRNRVAGDRMGSALARAATATFIGLDADFDLRALPTNIRAYIKVGARIVEAAYADGVKLLQERSPEKFRAWLTGRPTKFHNGRNAISSGYDYAGAVRSNLQLAFSTLTDEARAGAKVAMASAEKGAPAFIPERLRKANALAVNQTLYANNSDFIKQLGEVLGIPSDGARNDPRPAETILTGALHRYAHPSPDIDSYAAVDDFLDIIEDTYGPDKAARVGLLIAGHGAGHKAIQKYYNLGVTVNPEEAQVFQSWLHAEKMSDADRAKALRTAEKFGLDPRFVPVSGQFGTIHVPEAARKRLAAAMAKPSQNSLHWLSSPNDIGRGIYKDDVKPGQLAYDGIGFFVRGLKAGMTRGNLLVSSWFNFANTIDRMNQVATKAGFGAAMATMTRVLAQDMLIFTPLVSRAADVGRRFGVFDADAIEAMRRVLSEGGDRMAVAVQKMALANSCSISTNKVLDGVDETVNLGGRWYNYKDLRQVYIDQGVASSYAGELENSIRKSIRPPEGLVEKLGDRLASYMEYVEEMHEGLAERERVGAMLTFIEMGASPEDAAKLAVAALFDYGSSIAPAERSAFLALFFPFWAFQKNANMFTINSLLTPWGAYRVGVIRRTWEGSTEALSELIYGSVADPYGVDTEALGDVGRANYYALRAEIEAFYGGSERVPDDVVLALRHLFGQLPTYMMKDGKIQQLSEKLQNVVTLTSGSDRRTDPLTAHNAMLEIGEAYVPKPDPSKRAGYNRDRPTIAVTFPKTENMKRYLSLAGDDHPYVELMLPEQTIVAGLRHTLNLLAATVLLPQKLIAWADGAYTDDGVEKMWHGMDETYIAGPLTQVMDPDRSILLPEIAADFFGGEDPPPYRIAPVIGELMADLGLPLVKTDAVTDPFALGTDASPEAVAENARLMGNPAWTGRPASDKNVGIVSAPRYYVPGGVWATLCRRLSGFHDINKLLMSADESTLEGAAGLRGDLIVAASIALGIQEAESTGVKTAAREEPRKPDDALNPNK